MRALVAIYAVVAAEAAPAVATYAGYYEGNQMEMAAGLELGVNGRFQYGLAYGAMNEGSTGVWTADGDRILLSSDPVLAPEFRLADRRAGSAGELLVALQLPSGLPVQLFDLTLTLADGERVHHGFRQGEEAIPFEADNPPVSVQISLPMFDLQSPATALPRLPAGQGHALRFLFEPNDLGKVAFASTPLQIDNGDLLLERHDRLIRFRRVAP